MSTKYYDMDGFRNVYCVSHGLTISVTELHIWLGLPNICLGLPTTQCRERLDWKRTRRLRRGTIGLQVELNGGCRVARALGFIRD